MKHPWNHDVNVLLIFFVRDDVFAKTFAAVKEARPRRLLLFQDGPRESRKDDLEGIMRCRKIASNIDWDCEVYTNFQEKNYGCDPATFYSHKWAFSIVDKCIILEDDCVPSQSFFPFCKELLDKYEYDERICRICGMNNLGTMNNPYDYFFASAGSVWGWATWKRVANQWDECYSFLDDPYAMKLLSEAATYKRNYGYKKYSATCAERRKTGKPYWEYINSYQRLMQSQYVIVPTKNMISNIGLSENATHAPNDIRILPPSVRKLFRMKTYEYEFPLKHPKYVIESVEYLTLSNKKRSHLKILLYKIFYGRFDLLWIAVKRRFQKWF